MDHFVPHNSTVPANEGERVELFVREKVRGDHRRNRPAVLMVHGATLSTNTWDSQVECEDQFTPAIRDALRSTILKFDPLGSTWGSEDLWRAPVQNAQWGWNTEFAQQVKAPTLIIVGDLDTQTGVTAGRNLYDDLLTDSKVFVHIACAAHQLVWENRHMILLRASEKWLRHGMFAGRHSGSFWVDSEGDVHQE